jgi:signal transduction histidine kinase/two-component SAPR family response regulator
VSRFEGSDLFARGGEMGQGMRAHDWGATPLGDPANWPSSLRSALSICLGSGFPIAIYWGPQLALLYNDAWSPILGAKHPWALGRSAKDVWPEIWETIGPLFTHVLTTGEATYREDQLLSMRRHGYTEECYFNYTFSPIRGDEGRVDGIFNAVIETTFRVIAERRTRVLRELSDALSGARSAREACRTAARVLGISTHDVPFSLLYLLDPETGHAQLAGAAGLEAGSPAAPEWIALDDETSPWPIGRILSTGRIEAMENAAERTRQTLPGGPWPEPAHAALAAPLASGPGRVAGVLVAGVSPRLAIDDEYRLFVRQAAAQVASAIGNAEAFEAERRRAESLTELDRAKTAFFSNVSHEFRTPLTLILGPIADALDDTREPLSDTQRDRQEVVRRNALRLQKLVNTLLDYARVEAGRAQASFAPTDLARLTADLASGFRSAVESAGLALVVDCPPLDERVHVDIGMWEKIVMNLLSNAFKYTFDGGITVALRASASHAALEVRDTGSGIPVDEQPRIFERFHRVQGARGRSNEGTGIGLALVRELVEAHGGTIDVESTVGAGSTFRVTVPIGVAHLPADRLVEAPGTAGAGAAPWVEEALRWLPAADRRAPESTGRPRVLVADDNADMRDYVRHLLQPRYVVEVVGDGAAALEAAGRARPDLIVADVMMPVLDGFGLLQRIRDDDATRGIPVLMLSARAGDEARVEGLHAGADDYLVKPFSSGELVARVDAALHLARVREESQARVSEINKRLAEQLAEFETLLDVLPVGIGIAHDPECREIRVNPAFAQVLGIDSRANASKTAPRGERPENFRCLDDDGNEVPPTELPMQVAAARGTPVLGAEFNIVHDDGRVYRLLEYAAPLFDEHNRPRGSVGAFIDVTERTRVEKQREELLERERAAREEMDRLRQAAESASRAKDEFLAMLGHELRNPLAPIMTALQLMRLRGDGRLERERDVIERQVSHLTRLVDDLLDVSRIARGKVELKKEPVEIAEVVAKAIEQASPLLEARNHVLELNVPRAGLLVDADQIRLGQVISNLLTNAAKYTEAGGRISITARHEAGHVILSVRDTGIGISPDMLPRVFDLFAQETQSADRAQGGLGLGLTIVRNMVDLHAGSVSVSSDGLGKGSQFDVRLPALDVAERGALGGARSSPGAEPSREALRVLVVDDNQDAAEMLVEVLRSFGHDTQAAYDGPAALRLCRAFVPDVALLDIGLPVMDGYELAERMRELPGLAGVRLVAVTGYGQDSDRERSRRSGFHHHLVKPIDIDAIDGVIREQRPSV